MAESTKIRTSLSSLEIGALVAVLLALVGVAYYWGQIDSKVTGFEKRVTKLEDLNGLRVEKEKAIKEIRDNSEKSAESARKKIELIVDRAKSASIEDINALAKNKIENIIEAERSTVKAIEEANVRVTPVTSVTKPEKAPSSPVHELERNLTKFFTSGQDIPKTDLVVLKNKTHTIKSATETFGSVTLQENSTLIVPSAFAKVTLHIQKFVTEKGAKVVARGRVGNDGKDGGKGKNGSSACADGDNGRSGGPGLNGKDGSSVEIFTIDFVLAGGLIVDTSGGNGGNGGRGGNGGNGGEASRSAGCGGGDGGAGGTGGRAGNGGASGALSIHYVRAYSSGDAPISLPIVRTRVKHMATPGTAGLPGQAGNGGFGGQGMAGKSLLSGVNGIDGIRGQLGSPGIRGFTTIGQGP